jgi:hypothetical protein
MNDEHARADKTFIVDRSLFVAMRTESESLAILDTALSAANADEAIPQRGDGMRRNDERRTMNDEHARAHETFIVHRSSFIVCRHAH